MDLVTLTVFRAVAHAQGVTRAAEALGRAPSNVTTRIQQLEAELGTQLFHRQHKRMLLSQEGRLFLDYAERILNLADEARQRLDPTQPSGTLRIGAMESTIASRLSGPLAQFSRDWPDVTLELTSAPSRALLDALAAYRIDCAFAAFASDAALAETEFDAVPVYREALVLLVPPGHPPAATLDDLQLYTLAAFAPGCTYREIAQDRLAAPARAQGRVLKLQEVPSYHVMYGCTAAGACLSVMPRSVADLVRHQGAVQEVALGEVLTYLLRRAGGRTPAFEAFRQCLRPEAGAFSV
ncbi:LysR family transcriptional regulator [Thioclava sp. BHET1]|nr:LysR family transcriptional regulator [Thioclava sp. BHET1]